MAKLKPRARLIRTIGDRLISGPEAAIIELVKNSYDADSPSVEITIIPPSSDFSGKIIVKDEGHGMSYENILNDWLEPATDTKNKNKSSRSGSRQVLGAKGVGRFASASLGKSLKMTSVSKLDNEIYEISTLSLDWDIFENKKYLEDIDIDIDRRRTGNLTQSGVTIEIFDISTIWNEKKLRKLIRELRRLATPQYSLNTKFSIYLNLEKFTKDLDFPYNFDGKQLLDETNKLAEILQNSTDVTNEANLIKPYLISGESDYHLSGSFDEKGRFEGKFSIVRGDNF
ncbi:ATP-binding protein, partial [Escherichia coli]|nr:ATP-binding protein [Escherichia coli]